MNEGTLSSVLKLGVAQARLGVDDSRLRVGAVETFRVEQRIDAGTVRLLSRRFSLVARDNGLLSAGSTVRLRLAALSPQIQFQLMTRFGTEISGRDVEFFLTQNGVPVSLESIILAQMIVTSQRVLTPERIRAALRLWSRIGSDKALDDRTARLVVELADRGILDPDDDQSFGLLAYLSSLYGERGSGFDTGDSSTDDAQKRDSEIGSYLKRSTAEPDNILQLANAIAPSGDLHWVHIPIAAQRGGTRVDAVLRVAWNVHRRRADRAVLVASTVDGEKMWFQINLPSGELFDVAYSGELAAEMRNLLTKTIASLHSSVEPRTMEGDGFDLEKPLIPPGSLDSYA